MQKKYFGIDIDGTITCPRSFLPFINKAFQTELELEDMKDYNLIPLLNISEKEFWQWMDQNEADIYLHSQIVENAKNTLQAWSEKAHLHYITARRPYLEGTTLQWFEQNKVPYHQITHVGSHDKIKAVQNNKIELFFEDNYDNACAIAEHCKIPVLLFDMPYNQKPVPSDVIKIKDWKEAEDWVINHFSI